MALEIEPQEAAKTFENRIVSSSSEDDEPVQVKRASLKKRINLSDDSDDASPKPATPEGNTSSPEKSEHSSEEDQKANVNNSVSSAKKHKRRVLMRSDSEESDNEERASSRQSQNEDTQATQQQRILENLRSDNGYDAESSDEEMPNGRYSSNSRHSGEDEEEMAWEKEKNKSQRPKAPPRKSATACRKAMQEERLKMISESQRMVRESKASLPYHKPRQRTLQEFLKARPQPSPLLKGTKHQQVAIEVIGQELEKCEKLAEEFYKAASEDEEEKERLTPPPKTPELPTIPGENRVLKVSLSTSDSQSIQLNEHNEPEATTNNQDTQMTTTDSQTNDTQMTSTDSQMTEMSQPEESKITSESSSQHISSCPDTDPDSMPATENKPKTSEEPRKIILETPDSEYDSPPAETNNTKKTVIPDTPDSDPVSSDPKENTILALDTPDDFQLPEKNMEVSGNVIGETPDSETTDKSSQLAKLILSSENTDACLTPGDAEDNMFLKPAEKEKKTSDPLVEDSMDTDDFHLVLEDTDDIVADVPETPEVKNDKPLFDLEKLYNSGDLLGEETPKPELKGRAKILAAKLKLASGPVRLSGGPNELIDLDATPAVKEGLNDLVQRFMRQASAGVKKPAAKEGLLKLMQEGEAVEDAPDLKDKPGAKMSLLKSELRQSMAKLRDEEFKRRQREYQIYENEMEGIVGDDTEGKVLSDEEMEILEDEKDGAVSESGNTESEPELEDDVELKDAPLPRSKFMDDEAEESEHEEEVEDDIAKEEMEGLEEGPEESEEEDDPEESEESDEDEEEEKVQETSTPAGEKRKFSRIKKLDDSDDEEVADVPPEVKPLTSANKVDTLPLENTPDLPLEDTPDTNEKDKSFASVCNQSFNLSLLEEPSGSVEPKADTVDSRFPTGITQLCADTQMKAETANIISPVKSSAPKGLENLFQYSCPDEDIGGLCSGQFPPSDVPEGIEKLVQNSGTYPDDLGGLCSGQFPDTQPSKKIASPLKGLFGGGETQTQDDLAMLCSGQFLTQDPSQVNPTQVDKPKDLDKLISTSSPPTNLEDLCSGQFVTQAEVTGTQDKAEKTREISKTDDVIKTTDLDTDITNSSSTRGMLEMRIVSDDEDGEELGVGALSRKGKRKLAYSDDEDDGANGPEDAEEPMAEESELEDVLDDEEGVIDYDSEENEVVVKPQQFFEAEAELSGEEDWGSADEDEAGLDRLEEELGDKEAIDDEELASQLGKIHARRLLDDDKRDVRLFQEAFLEDGDLHSEGGGRQRLFRWKNSGDNSWAAGARPDLQGEEGVEEEEGEAESAWRSARLERETWLQQNKDKLGVDEDSQLLQMGRSLLAKMNSNGKMKPPQVQNPKPSIINKSKSPSKAFLNNALKGKSGSFLARRSISMSRVVALTSSEGAEGCTVNVSSRNFVFTSISPGTNKMQPAEPNPEEASPQSEPTNKKKRAMKSKPAGAQPQLKKKKVASSLFQLL